MAEKILAGDVRDGQTVAVGAALGRLTLDGAPVGGEGNEAPAIKPTVVQFPKG